MEKRDEKIYNTKEFNRIRTKGSRKGLKGLVCFLLLLLFLSVSVVSCIFGAYLSARNNRRPSDSAESAAVNGTVENGASASVSTDYLVQICVYNDESYRIASGMMISENGYILTCDHLFRDISSPQMLAVFQDGSALKAAYIGGDDRTDTAVLKVESRNLDHIVLDPSKTAQIGDTVYVAECSQNDNAAAVITKGVLSSDQSRVATNTEYPLKLLQFDAAVNEGASGGALLNANGEWIGMIVAKSTEKSGVGYAIGVDRIGAVIDELIENGCVNSRVRVGIGFEFIGVAKAYAQGTCSGLRIVSVSKDSDLFQQGFEAGDTVTAVNGTHIYCLNDFYDIVEESAREASLLLTIRRKNGEERQISVRLLTEKGSNSYSP